MKKKTNRSIVIAVICLFCFSTGWYWGSRKSRASSGIVEDNQSANTEGTQAKVVAIEPIQETEEVFTDFPNIDFSLPTQVLLQNANAIEKESKRHLYLKALLNFWISNDSSIPSEERDRFLAGLALDSKQLSFGFVAGMSHYVAMLSDATIREEWKENYADHPSRSEIFSQFLSQDLLNNRPESLFAKSDQWNEWEREFYNDNVLAEWALGELSSAFAWYESYPAEFGPASQQKILDIWAQNDFEGLAAHLHSINDEGTRSKAIEALAKHKSNLGTNDALDWAISLATAAEQDLANEIIYRETPRGVGAVIRPNNGFAEVVEPLVPNGLQKGDLIVSASNVGTGENLIFGEGMDNALDLLLGEPGSVVTVQIMRQDPETGEYRQMEVKITRQQLLIPDGHEHEP